MQEARIRKINSLIQDQLGQLILEECDWTRSVVLSLTKVDTSPDLAQSKIYVSILAGTEEERQQHFQHLQQEAKRLRYLLAQRIELRKIPYLRLILDDSLEVSQRISQLIDETH